MNTNGIDRRLQALQSQLVLENEIIAKGEEVRPNVMRAAVARSSSLTEEINAIREEQKVILAAKEDPNLHDNVREERNTMNRFNV